MGLVSVHKPFEKLNGYYTSLLAAVTILFTSFNNDSGVVYSGFVWYKETSFWIFSIESISVVLFMLWVKSNLFGCINPLVMELSTFL